MPIGGKLVLKGGVPVKSKKKKQKKLNDAAKTTLEEAEEPKPDTKAGSQIKPEAVTVSGKTYEEEFDLEMAKAKEGKVKNTPWGSSFRAPPKILHGYSAPVTGKTAEERLDLRCATRTDKFCK